jgi:hypothetical protein
MAGVLEFTHSNLCDDLLNAAKGLVLIGELGLRALLKENTRISVMYLALQSRVELPYVERSEVLAVSLEGVIVELQEFLCRAGKSGKGPMYELHHCQFRHDSRLNGENVASGAHC